MWLLRQDVAEEFRRAYDAQIRLAPDALTASIEAFSRKGTRKSGITSVAGNAAEIRIEGVLTPQPDFLAFLTGEGNTTYQEIRDALASADSDPTIKKASLYINSPGGRVDGLFETIDAIRAFSKPLSVRASRACSAAYALAAAGGQIEAIGDAAEFGSIGVAATYFADEHLIDITSSNAPDKRPNPATEEGKAVIQRHLDAIHELFVESIAQSRGISIGDVNANFGRGAVVLTREAKRLGMIDRAPKASAKPRPRADAEDVEIDARGNGAPEQTNRIYTNVTPLRAAATTETNMTEQELQQQHPALFAAVFNAGRAEGEKVGAEKSLASERDRVSAHLHMGEQSGDMKTALDAVRSGAGMSLELTAKYMTAGMNRRDMKDSVDEGKQMLSAVSDASTHVAEKKAELETTQHVFLDDLRKKKVS